MIEIKNISHEEIEIVTQIDLKVPGCRIKDSPPEPIRLKPGVKTMFLGYEPGVSLIVRPVQHPERHRSTLV